MGRGLAVVSEVMVGRQNATEVHARDGGVKVLRARARSIRVETPETNDTNQTDETKN